MADLYFSEEGDLAQSPSGDLAITPAQHRDDVQQAYIRVMTEQGDYLLYPDIGASLTRLYGMPQSPQTGAYGEKLIRDALTRDNRFIGQGFTVKAVPIDFQTIRFDVFLNSGSRSQIRLSFEQDLVPPGGA